GAVGKSRRGVCGRWSGGSPTAAEQVRADDEEPVGIEGLPGADHSVPPAQATAPARVTLLGAKAVPGASAGWRPREAGRVGIATESMANQDDGVAGRRQRPIGLVGYADRIQLPAAVEGKRTRKIQVLGVDRADGARGRLRRWRGHASDHILSR